MSSTDEITEKDLYFYMDLLFKESKFYTLTRYLCLLVSLVSLIYSTFAHDEHLYYLFLSAFVFQFLAWLLIIKIRKINFLAHKFKKILMLKKSYGVFPNNPELAHLIIRVSKFSALINKASEIYKKLKAFFSKDNKIGNSSYLLKDETTSRKALLSMIQEDSFWNHHLYRSTFIIYSSFILLGLIITIFGLLFFIPNSGVDSSILLIAFIFLSFTIVYEFLDKVVMYYESSVTMLEIDNEIEINFENKEINMIDTFYKFSKTIEKTPPIPSVFYNFQSDKINKAWKARVVAWQNNHKNYKLLK